MPSSAPKFERLRCIPRTHSGYDTVMRIGEDFLAFMLTAALAVFAVVGLLSYAVTTLK
jgi:hypothetical protein